MTITLDLELSVEADLREKAVQEGQNKEAVVQFLLAQAAAWNARDQAEALEGVHRDFAASDAGRVHPAADVFADMRARRSPSSLGMGKTAAHWLKLVERCDIGFAARKKAVSEAQSLQAI